MELALIRVCVSGTDLLVGFLGAATIAAVVLYDWGIRRWKGW